MLIERDENGNEVWMRPSNKSQHHPNWKLKKIKKNNMITLQQLIDNYTSSSTDTRLKRRKKTGEFYTPYSIIKKMIDKIEPEMWADPDRTFLEPSFGDGNFIIAILYRRIVEYGIDWKTALKTCTGVELMQDNVYETHGRIIKLFDALGIDYDEDVAMDIMLRNLVCHDFFTWNFEEWRPYTEEELKKLKNK